MKVIEKVHYEDILEPKIVRLFQPLVKNKMDQLFITSEHFAIDIDKLLFQLNLTVKYIKMEGNTSGYLSGRTIYINNNHSINNTRFAIARELGHYLYKYKDNNDNSINNLREITYESDVNQFSV
ncbi:TPA: ImmA/IrrE family metallo-endopeptidase, partial [Staphylococcus aureus]|nr:ImmA/IrrE family metallo-endopeptidase [Staphylococcus aureus]